VFRDLVPVLVCFLPPSPPFHTHTHTHTHHCLLPHPQSTKLQSLYSQTQSALEESDKRVKQLSSELATAQMEAKGLKNEMRNLQVGSWGPLAHCQPTTSTANTCWITFSPFHLLRMSRSQQEIDAGCQQRVF
jgi:hypothetical protein